MTRRELLRAWAAWDDLAKDEHGTPQGVSARATANRLAEAIGDFTDDDLRVIDGARVGYRLELA